MQRRQPNPVVPPKNNGNVLSPETAAPLWSASSPLVVLFSFLARLGQLLGVSDLIGGEREDSSLFKPFDQHVPARLGQVSDRAGSVQFIRIYGESVRDIYPRAVAGVKGPPSFAKSGSRS